MDELVSPSLQKELDRHHNEDLVRGILKFMGESPQREGLKETPRRVLDAWKFWTSGYNQEPKDVLKTFVDGAEDCDELVFQGSIALWSLCEHHVAPFWGVAHIGYLPNGKIVGLSKLSRLVEIFARRLQVQERLGNQIADALFEFLDARGVGVVLQCRHTCIESRGVQKQGSITTTSALRGIIKYEPEARAEFMTLVQIAASKTMLV